MSNQKLLTATSAMVILLISVTIGMLIYQDKYFTAPQVQSGVVEGYQTFARNLVEDGFFSYFDPAARVSNLNNLGHPPGYSFLLALIYYFVGESNFAIQIITIFISGLSAVTVFLIAQKLFSAKVGFLTGLLAAFCPQFALNSVFLLPDTTAIFPILLAVYFWVQAFYSPRFSAFVLSAVCLAVSCWLRANSFLLPLFFLISIPLLFEKGVRLKYAGVFLLTFILTISPITIRNAFVYGEFVPISLGAGQTLLEGISDYDTEKRFGIPQTDMGIMQMEAEKFNCPEYGLTLFGKDGFARDRRRIAQGWQVIKENPFWFAGVMFRRGMLMTKLERGSSVSTAIPVSQPLSENKSENILRQFSPEELLTKSEKISPDVQMTVVENKLILRTDNSKNNPQIGTEPISLEKNYDYFTEVDLRLVEGRTLLKAQGTESNRIYGLTTIELMDWKTYQPEQKILMTFVADQNEPIRIIIYNEPHKNLSSLVELKEIRIYRGEVSPNTWTKPLRLIVNSVQKFYITAVMLTLMIIGLIILIMQKQFKIIIILAIVPVYYFTVQSALHTEYRYVLAIHYFTFIIAAFCLTKAVNLLILPIKHLMKKQD